MKHFLLLCSLITWALNLFPQEFNAHWISTPTPDSTSHVWFRQTYMMKGRPQNAHITIASTGYFKLYINEFIVGTAAFYPARQPYSDNIIATTFDVTRFMRADTNVVAIVYSPSFPHTNHRQISAELFGIDHNDNPFCYVSDKNWICKPANSCLKITGGEFVDGRKHTNSWKQTQYDPALWQGVICPKINKTDSVVEHKGSFETMKITARRGYRYFDIIENGVQYDFANGFNGWIRLTLRNAAKGETISFQNIDYICNGELDEQASPVFFIDNYRKVLIQGDQRFARDQIMDIEAIELTPVSTVDFNY